MAAKIEAFAAEQVHRVTAGANEDVGDQAGSRGLPMRSGDGDDSLAFHQFRDHFGAEEDGQLPLASFGEFRVFVSGSGGGHDKSRVRGDVFGGVPVDNLRRPGFRASP